MAGAAGHHDLDLHPAALAAVDPQGPLLRVARALGEDDDVRDELGRGAGEDVAHQVEGAAAVVVLLGRGGVGAHDDAAKRPLRRELEQDLRRDDLGHDAGELVGGAAAEQEVVPLAVRRQVAEEAAQRRAVHAGEVQEAVVGVDAAVRLLPPLRPQGLHGVGVAVHVDDALLAGGNAVRVVLHGPDEVAVGVEARVLRAAHGAHLDDRPLQVLHPRSLVVAEAAEGVPALLDRLVHVVGRDADGLGEDARGEWPVARGEGGVWSSREGMSSTPRGPAAGRRGPRPSPRPGGP